MADINWDDYDLSACLRENPQDGFDYDAVAGVLAVHEGANDGDDWRWVLRLKDGRYVFLQGGCDYTGWECQSWATSHMADDPVTAANYARGNVPVGAVGSGNHPADAGMGHMLELLTGGYGTGFEAVRESLLRQLADGKDETWRGKAARELGLTP